VSTCNRRSLPLIYSGTRAVDRAKVTETEAFMAEDSTSPDKLKQLDDRLNYLESVARETVARLYAVEKHLGLVFKAVPKHLDQPAPTDEQARDSRLRAVEEALKRVPPIAPEKPAPEELQTKPREVKPATEDVQTRPTAEVPSPEPPLTESPVRDVPPSTPVAGESPTKIPAVAPPTEDRPSGKEPQAPVPPARDRRVLGAPVPQGPPAPRVRPAAPSIAPRAFAKRGDLEARIGGNWFNRIGIIAIFLGVTFFLKYAIDNEWIGPTGRVLIGVAIGLGFLALGERLRKRYASYAYGLTGGGIAILYAAIWFASGNKYGLLSQTVAFGMMALVTATASLLSARYNALPIAVLGLIGGFLTPILLSTGVDNEAALFTYIAFLDLGVLALAYSKQWRSLNYMAFISTVLMFAGWMAEWYTSEKLWTTMIFLTVLFAIFALLAVLYNVVNRRPTGWLDLAMVFSNALLYFGTSYELLDDHNHGILGLFALLISVFYMGLGYLTFRRDRDDNLLILTFLGLSFLFAVLAVPIQFDQHWVTMGWAIEGAVMSWIGLRANDRTSRNAALVVFGIAITHWFYVDMRQFAYHANETFTPLFNLRAFSCAVLVASLSAAVWFYKNTRSDISDDERSMFRGLYLLAANTMAVILLSLDANDYFNQKKGGVQLAGTEKNQLDNAHYFTISALWSIYGAAALIVGIKRRLKPIRAAAMLLLAAATALVLALNLSYYSAPWHTVAFNETFGAFALLIGALSSGAWFYAKEKNINSDERRAALGLLIGAANLLAIVALSAEALGHFDRAQAIASGEVVAHLENSKQFVLSAVWTIFGATALAVGIRRRSEAVRTGSLLLLALTTAKVGAVDVQYYNARWHSLLFNPTFGAFSLVVLSLAIGAWLYVSAKDVSDRERGAALRLLIGVSSLLLVVAFSAEALGYYDRAQALSSGEVVRQLENTKQLALSSVWVVFGCAALIIGVQRRLRALRIGALLLLAVATVKALFVDLRYYDAGWHNLLLNPTFAVFALLIAGFALSVWFYARAEDIPERERGVLIPVLLGAANLLAIIALSLEALGHYAVMMRAPGLEASRLADLRLAQQLSISVVWTIYGGAMLTFGMARRSRLLRIMGLLLLSLTIFKVFLFDLSSLERLYRIISFIVLGLILLAVSFLYQRYRQRVAELIGDVDAEAPVGAE
jgi:uncharacterized membrane protein